LKVKQGIFALYRSEWLDVANFVFISACVQCGYSAEEGVKRFQKFLNLGEDELDTDSLKTSYYRSLKKFRSSISDEKKYLKSPPEMILSESDLELIRTIIQEEMTCKRVKTGRRKTQKLQ